MGFGGGEMCKAVIGKWDEGRGEKRERICKAMK